MIYVRYWIASRLFILGVWLMPEEDHESMKQGIMMGYDLLEGTLTVEEVYDDE